MKKSMCIHRFTRSGREEWLVKWPPAKWSGDPDSAKYFSSRVAARLVDLFNNLGDYCDTQEKSYPLKTRPSKLTGAGEPP